MLAKNVWRAAAASLSVAAVVSAAACSSSASTPASSSTSSSSPDTAGSSSAAGADVAAAQAALAPYVGKSSAFPVTDSLASKLPAAKKFVYLQCSTPICAEVGE